MITTNVIAGVMLVLLEGGWTSYSYKTVGPFETMELCQSAGNTIIGNIGDFRCVPLANSAIPQSNNDAPEAEKSN